MKTNAVAIIGSGPAGLMLEDTLHALQGGYICKGAARNVNFPEEPNA